MAYGTVKWFNDSRGYGFIIVEGTNDEVFVHHSNIMGKGFRWLAEGERVAFTLDKTDKGLNARGVTKLNGGTL